MTKREWINIIKYELENNKFPLAINKCKSLVFDDPSEENNLANIHRRWKENEQQISNRVIRDETYQLEKNRLHLDLMRFLDSWSTDESVTFQHMENGIQKSKTIIGLPKFLTNQPFVPDVFEGREEDVKAIHEHLFQGENILLIVNGEGGIGKTTLAAKYFHEYKDEYHHLAWLFAERGILNAILLLNIELKINFTPNIPEEEKLDIILRRMAELEKPCLLVIDNANDIKNLDLYYGKLKTCTNFHLLLTSRINEYEQATCHKANILNDDILIRIFKKHYKKKIDEDILKQLIYLVGGNTLVIELLAKSLYFKNRLNHKYTLPELIQDLTDKGIFHTQADKKTQAPWSQQRNIPKSEPKEVIKALYDLEPLPEMELKILQNLSVLPAVYIDVEILENQLLKYPNLDEHLYNLYQKGWIELEEKENAYSQIKISPVVQAVVLEVTEDIFEANEGMIKNMVILLDYNPGIGHFINIDYDKAFLLSAWAEHLTNKIYLPKVEIGKLLECIANSKRVQGNPKGAIQYQIKSKNIFKKINKIDNNEYNEYMLATAEGKLGHLYAINGNFTQGEKLLKKGNKSLKSILSRTKNKTIVIKDLAASFSMMGHIYEKINQPKKAMKMYQNDLRLSKKLYQNNKKDLNIIHGLATTLNQISVFLLKEKAYNKALLKLKQSLDLTNSIYYKNNNSLSIKNQLANTHSNLMRAYGALGKIKEALEHAQIQLTLFQEMYNDNKQNNNFKLNYAISCGAVGDILFGTTAIEDSIEYFKLEKDLLLELLEESTEDISITKGLAISYSKIGHFHAQYSKDSEKAKSHYLQAQQLWEELVKTSPQYAEFSEYLEMVKNDIRKLE